MSKFETALSRRCRLRPLTAGLAAVAILGLTGGPDDARAASCAGAQAMPAQGVPDTIARATLCLINVERRGRGLHPLRSSRRLAAAARGHSLDMVRKGYFSHTAPEGSGVVQRIRHSGYLHSAKRWRVGENLGWGSRGEGSPRAMVRAWMNSPPHRRAILTSSYRDAGIGVVLGVPGPLRAPGATYTVDFGVKR
jgi:uncharacterized protein YkwD